MRRPVVRTAAVSVVVLLATWAGPGPALGQGGRQPRWLVEAPTAGLLPHKTGGMEIRLYEGNGVLGGLEWAFYDRVSLGATFGGQHLIGSDRADWNPRVGLQARVRLLEEKEGRPALALGFSSQGYGAFVDSLDRYTAKSLGFYAAFSRNYRAGPAEMGLHFGLNRSMEDRDGDGGVTAFVGTDVSFTRRLTLMAEYQIGLNDDEAAALGTGRGYLNGGVRWSFSEQFAIEFDLKNLLQNGGAGSPGREGRILYVLD